MGSLQAVPRTQESVALSADGEHWFLLNVSPEVRQQIESFPGLWPRRPRHSPIAGIILNNGDLDHCLGLLSLRESYPLVGYATESVRNGFCEGNVLYRTLQRFPEQLRWETLALGREVPLLLPDGGVPSGLTITALPVPGKRPLHLETLGSPSPEDNVGLRIRDTNTGKTLAYLSAVAGWSPVVDELVSGADCIFFDGTFWTGDELVAAGLGTRRAEDMAHWPVGGPGGSMKYLAERSGRRVLIHINNTNPLLREGGPERAELASAGIELAHDGLELEL